MPKMCHKNCDVLAHDNALVRYISVPYFSEDKRGTSFSHTETWLRDSLQI